VKPLLRYSNLSFFQDGGRPRFLSCGANFGTTHNENLVVSITMQTNCPRYSVGYRTIISADKHRLARRRGFDSRCCRHVKSGFCLHTMISVLCLSDLICWLKAERNKSRVRNVSCQRNGDTAPVWWIIVSLYTRTALFRFPSWNVSVLLVTVPKPLEKELWCFRPFIDPVYAIRFSPAQAFLRVTSMSSRLPFGTF